MVTTTQDICNTFHQLYTLIKTENEKKERLMRLQKRSGVEESYIETVLPETINTLCSSDDDMELIMNYLLDNKHNQQLAKQGVEVLQFLSSWNLPVMNGVATEIMFFVPHAIFIWNKMNHYDEQTLCFAVDLIEKYIDHMPYGGWHEQLSGKKPHSAIYQTRNPQTFVCVSLVESLPISNRTNAIMKLLYKLLSHREDMIEEDALKAIFGFHGIVYRIQAIIERSTDKKTKQYGCIILCKFINTYRFQDALFDARVEETMRKVLIQHPDLTEPITYFAAYHLWHENH